MGKAFPCAFFSSFSKRHKFEDLKFEVKEDLKFSIPKILLKKPKAPKARKTIAQMKENGVMKRLVRKLTGQGSFLYAFVPSTASLSKFEDETRSLSLLAHSIRIVFEICICLSKSSTKFEETQVIGNPQSVNPNLILKILFLKFISFQVRAMLPFGPSAPAGP